VFHGWEDSLVVPEGSVGYWNAVQNRYQRKPGDDSPSTIGNSYRLFMIPGLAHCDGVPGAETFDPLSVMVNWVEHGVAPDRMIARKLRSDSKASERASELLLCPYPQTAEYRGSGNVEEASSYSCIDPGDGTISH
jgi:feruloyl esterase